MATSCTFNALPRAVVTGGAVRFFPVVTGNTLPIVSYSWDFGDTTSSTDATPTHTYTAASRTSYTVVLTVTDANGGTATHTGTDFITVDVAANVPAIPTDGSYNKVSVYITDGTNSMMVNRNRNDLILNDAVLAIDFENDFTDYATGKTATNHGALFSTTWAAHGFYSGLYGGSYYTTWPDSADWNFGTGNFAIGIKFKPVGIPSVGDYATLFSWYVDDDNRIEAYIQNAGAYDVIDFQIVIAGVQTSIVSTTHISAGTAYSLIITREGNLIYMYVNDSIQNPSGLAFSGSMPDLATTLDIGGRGASRNYTGYIDEFIIIKGRAIHKSADILVSDQTSNFYLLSPKVVTFIDSSPTTTFALLDVGDTTATERGLIAEGSEVLVLSGNSVLFSGVIRRATQSITNGYSSTTRVKKWEIECDSGLMLLKKKEVESTVLDTYGDKIYDTPGYIARTVLTPSTGEWDWRGNICCNDTKITYQLNSSTSAESAGSQYDHIVALQQKTNYDLVVEPYYEIYTYTAFNGAVITVNHNYSNDELIGYTVFFLPQAGEKGVTAWGVITDNTTSSITGTFKIGDAQVTGNILIYFGNKVNFAPDLSTQYDIATYNVNEDVFEYNDNDDKNKFCSKVVVKGKDTTGKSISVSISGVHAYDEDRQYYNDSTHITLKSEGYVYRNMYESTGVLSTSDVYVCKKNVVCNTDHSVNPNKINMAEADAAYFHAGMTVWFTDGGGNCPAALGNPANCWYVKSVGTDYITVCLAYDGSVLDLLGDGSNYLTHTNGGVVVDNSGTYLPTTGIPYFYWGGLTGPDPYKQYISGGEINTDTDLVICCADPDIGLVRTPTIMVDITADSTGAYIFKNPSEVTPIVDFNDPIQVWLYGWGYSIPTGSTVALVTPFGSAEGFTTTGPTVELTDSSGVQCTKVFLNKLPKSNYDNKGYFLNRRLYVEDYSQVGNNEVYIGEEKITVNSGGNDTTYGNYIQFSSVTARITSATLKCYPHGVGALVARTNYTEASPETGSAVKDYGIVIDQQTVDTTTTFGDLDTYATIMLLGKGTFYRKATCWGLIVKCGVERVGLVNQANVSSPPRVGDLLSIDPSDSETAIEYEIVKLTFDIDKGKILFELGDYEKNMFTSLLQKTFAINTTLS